MNETLKTVDDITAQPITSSLTKLTRDLSENVGNALNETMGTVTNITGHAGRALQRIIPDVSEGLNNLTRTE